MRKDFDLEKQWEINTTEARAVLGTKRNCQMKVARLALEVCEITWGGAIKRDYFTLANFAKECGCNPKTLSTWVNIEKNVYSKVSPDEAMDLSYTVASTVARHVDRGTPPEEVTRLVRDMKAARGSFDARMSKYLKYLSGLDFNFETKLAADLCKREVLEEILFYTDRIRKNIRKGKHKNLRSINHNIASRFGTNNLSANRALGTPGRVSDSKGLHSEKLNKKDMKILEYIKKSKRKWHSPTDVGMTLGGYSKSSASAWAYRTFKKLESVDLMKRSDRGHYCLTKRAIK